MSHDPAEVKKHVRGYLVVFLALACLTVLTVKVSTLHLTTGWAIGVALVIATTKASLVAAYFMHLISERPLIYLILSMTIVFFIVLLVLPSISLIEMVRH
jgi:cytochrome c oxidase subunit 4